MKCEDAELLVGMRERGAVEPGQSAELEAHLASCAACRAFAESSDLLSEELLRRGRDTPRPPPKEEVAHVLRRHRRAQRFELLRIAGALVALAALVHHFEHPSGASWLGAIGVGGALVLVGGVMPRHRRVVAALGQVGSHEELVVQLRNELAQRLRERTWTDGMAVAALPAVLALDAIRNRVGPGEAHHHSSEWYVLLAACGIYGVVDLLVGVPRLKRERAGLE